MEPDSFPRAGAAELWLISDFPLGDEHLRLIVPLMGPGGSERDIKWGENRRTCRWPLRVPYAFGDVGSLAFHVYHCAAFLHSRRAAVAAIRNLGCNLELCFHVAQLAEYLSIATATMEQLAALQIQLSFVPVPQ